MSKVKSSAKTNQIALAIVYIALGVLFCVYQGSVLEWLLTAAGILFIVVGIVDIIRGNLITGVLEIIVGAVIILCGWLILWVALIIFGVLLVVRGFIDLTLSIRLHRVFGVIFAILAIVIGCMLAASHFVALDWFFIAIGVVFVIDGVCELANGLAK